MSQQDRDGRPVVSLPAGPPTKPFVHPGVPPGAVDHAAAAFEAAKAQRQRQNAPPKGNVPVAGGPTPRIPHLAGAPQHPGMTMAQHAAAERGGPAPAAPSSSGFVEPAMSIGPNQVAPSPAALGILPTDELPPQAQQDPEFVNGMGAMFAANQPKLAMKYGVVRKGKLVPPQQLRGQPQSQLRPETVRDIEALQSFQQHQQTQQRAEGDGPSEMGRAAGTVGVPGATFSEDDKKKIEDTVNSLDEFDFDQFRQSMMRDILNNEQQKKVIEARLKPMDVGDIITSGFIIQRVDIVPGKFWVEFKTMDGETDLALKRLIMEDSRSVEVNDRYYLDKFSVMSIAAVVHKINDKPYGDFVDQTGNFDDAKFRAKFKQIIKLPMPMLSSLGANAMWFDMRVRKLFKAEEVGNG